MLHTSIYQSIHSTYAHSCCPLFANQPELLFISAMQINWLASAILVAYASNLAAGQLAFAFSNVSQHNNCKTWSSWGNCIWLKDGNTKTSNLYLTQQSSQCQKHWFVPSLMLPPYLFIISIMFGSCLGSSKC